MTLIEFPIKKHVHEAEHTHTTHTLVCVLSYRTEFAIHVITVSKKKMKSTYAILSNIKCCSA